MAQISVAQVIAAKKISRFMSKYMRTTRALLLFFKDLEKLAINPKNNLVSDKFMSFFRKLVNFPSKSVQAAASNQIHQLDWENVNNDHDWEIISLGENQQSC